MIYVDPLKLEAHQMSAMDVVRAVNDANLILPAGDVKIGPVNYSIYTNSQLRDIDEINRLPLKTINSASVKVADVGEARDAQQIQYNVVRVDGQRSVYLPVLKQGGDTNTIAVVDGVKDATGNLFDVPKELITQVVFDQSLFVKRAIKTLLSNGAAGLFLTSLMILVFLGSMRATVAVFLSIPLSALATFLSLWAGGSSVNTMILGGLALAFSRLIHNSIVVLENIYRRLEMGEPPEVAAEKGGQEVALPVLASTLTTVVVFFPVTFLYGVSKFLFSALALAVVLSLFASYVVALTVVPLFCAKLLKSRGQKSSPASAPASVIEGGASPLPLRGKTMSEKFSDAFARQFDKVLSVYERGVRAAMSIPRLIVAGVMCVFLLSLLLYPLLQVSFFPRSDAGQFLVNIKAPSGTRLEVTEREVKEVEEIIRKIVAKEDLATIVSNIGVTPGFSSIYTSNSAQHTAFVQVSLTDDHKIGSYEYMNRVREQLSKELPHLSTYFQSGGLVDAVLNMGLPAPIDVQVSGSNLEANYEVAVELARRIRRLPGVSDVYTPQDLDYPALQLDVDRTHASQLGLTQKEIVHNVITALTSNQMIAPSYWIDPKSGNDYLLTVQYAEGQVKSLSDLKGIPLRSAKRENPTRLDAVSSVTRIQSPTEVDHYQLRRIINLYVSPAGEDLGQVANAIDGIIAETRLPAGVRVDLRGMVQGMRSSFVSFGTGLILAIVLLFLILVASFRSFKDPFLILLAVPPGATGVLLTLYLTGTTLNVQSLMGIVMMVGIVVSNSILIVDFAHRLREEGRPVRDAIVTGARVRLRPIVMSALATLMGLLPMALKLGTGSEAYAPLARAILGGLMVSVVLTIFAVPAAYYLFYREPEVPVAQPVAEKGVD
jgi:multidrug efflux pump subunit AcrB